MPSSKIPSPARSLDVKSTPRRYKHRRTRSVTSPARSENSVKLTALLPDSIVISPLPQRRSVLTDDTDVDMPKRQSWWKRLDENSRDVIELLEHKDVPESNNIEENFDVEILSQEKKNYTMDLPESSDGESISSIVIPQRKLFTHKENQPPKKFPLINNREELAKLQKSHVDHDKEIEVRPKNLFNNAKKPKTTPIFPAGLLNISKDKSVANKTKEMPVVEPKGQVRNLFGNRQGNKRKNMFADFLVSESEDEIPEIQTKVFGFQKKNVLKRKSTAASEGLQHSPASSIVDIDMDDWIHLPSSTMVENQIEEQAATPSKRTRLSKLIETKQMNTVDKSTKSNNRSKEYSSSKANIDLKELNTSKNVGGDKINQLNKTLTKSQNDVNSSKLNKSNDISPKENVKLLDENQCELMNIKNKNSCILEDKEQILSNQNESDAEDDFTLEYENDEDMENNSSKSEKIDIIPDAEKENSKIEKNNITNKQFSPNIDESRKLHDMSKSKNKSKISSKSLNKSAGDTVPMDCDNELLSNEILTSAIVTRLDRSNVKNNRSSDMLCDDENNKKDVRLTNEKSYRETAVNKTNKDKRNTRSLEHQEVDEPDNNDVGFVNHNDSEINRNKKVPQGKEPDSEFAKNNMVDKTVESQNLEPVLDVIDNEVSKNLNDCDVSKIQETSEEQNDETTSDNNELSQNITEHENDNEEMPSENSDNESQELEPESEKENKSEESQNEEEEESEIQSTNEDEIDLELDYHHESNIDDDNNKQNEQIQASNNSQTENQNDSSTKVTPSTSLRSENQKTHETRIESPEAILNAQTKNLIDSFTLENRNSPRKTKSIFKQLTLRPSLAPARESTGFSDNSGNSTANSGWDSHRTTRKTLRKTFGKDFTPRKSLRTLVMEKSAKRQTFNPDLKDLSKHPHANSTELPAHDNQLEGDSVENIHESIAVSSGEEMEEAEEEKEETEEEQERTAEEIEEERVETVEDIEETEKEQEITAGETEEEKEETLENKEETVETEESVEESEESVEEREESVEESEESLEEREESVEEREESVEEKEESVEEREEFVEEREDTLESIDEMEQSKEDSKEPLEEREETIEEREETLEERESNIEERVESLEVGGETIEEEERELPIRMRQTTLEMFLQKIKKQELERKMKIREDVINSLKVAKDTNLFKYPNIPVRRNAKLIQRKAKPKVIQTKTLNAIPEEVLEDLKYKPPKRFQPRSASWATKRLYTFLETKLEPKYDYMARVRAEKLVETIYEFTKQIRRHEVAPLDAVASLKREMARLKVVETHYEFYDFFHEYMPREVRVKVNPDPVNRIQMPRDVFANIIQ